MIATGANDGDRDFRWDRFIIRIIRRLLNLPPESESSFDGLDVELGVFESIMIREQMRELPHDESYDGLQSLLLLIVKRKMLKRLGHDADPDWELLITESVDEIVKSLADDPELERVVKLRLSGRSSGDIAKELNRSLATVERKLKMIRTIWSKQEE